MDGSMAACESSIRFANVAQDEFASERVRSPLQPEILRCAQDKDGNRYARRIPARSYTRDSMNVWTSS